MESAFLYKKSRLSLFINIKLNMYYPKSYIIQGGDSMSNICPGFVKEPQILSIEDIRSYEINNVYNGIPLLLLMENAGRAVADAVECRIGDLKNKKVIVYAGRGGNGGDALVASKHLSLRGADVTVYLLYDFNLVEHQDTLVNLKSLINSKQLKIIHLQDPKEYKPQDADVLIDGILGIGIKGKLREPIASALKAFNSSTGLRVAVDVPTGVDPETGNVVEGAAIADVTVTMHSLKPGLIKEEARNYVGEIMVAEIGIIKDSEIYGGPGDVLFRIPKRPKDAIKGGNGKVLTIGGSYHYFGAPYYASSAALLSGADLVFLASPEKVAVSAAQNNPGIIPFPLKGEYINEDHINELIEEAKKVDVVAIGPGLGNKEETRNAVIKLINSLKGKPMVIDADALKSIANSDIKLWEEAVLTPHRGEAVLLAGRSGEPDNLSMEIAKKYNATVIVKGPIDVICLPNGKCRYNKTGHPAMAVGGTGDVLTGIISGFLSRRIALMKDANILHTVTAAAYISGKAGELAVKEKGENITALDVLYNIQNAIKEVEVYSRGSG